MRGKWEKKFSLKTFNFLKKYIRWFNLVKILEICSDQLRLFDTVMPIYLWLSTIWTSSFLMITGECFLSPFLKSRIISLVLGTLRSRKWISHHSSKLSISLLYTVSSSFTIKPWMVESSANFKRQTWILFSDKTNLDFIFCYVIK